VPAFRVAFRRANQGHSIISPVTKLVGTSPVSLLTTINLAFRQDIFVLFRRYDLTHPNLCIFDRDFLIQYEFRARRRTLHGKQKTVLLTVGAEAAVDGVDFDGREVC
jgi:hypothetical protein